MLKNVQFFFLNGKNYKNDLQNLSIFGQKVSQLHTPVESFKKWQLWFSGQIKSSTNQNAGSHFVCLPRTGFLLHTDFKKNVVPQM